ncbi:MAG TPA: glutathione S-transferase [Usitatibacter sp.]|jgi:glutathione S-transferase|nr:glutathione S-transferase [Usitatibacter sp.]
MKLHYSAASPFVRKVLVCAHELGLAGQIELVTTKVVPSEPNRDYARVAPLMKVPALQTDDGLALFDSVVICEYLDDRAGGGKLFPARGEARWRALRLHAAANGILDAAVLNRYETFLRPEALRWKAWSEGQLLKVDQSLDFLEQNAGELAHVDIGSIGAGCALGYLDFRYADRDWRAAHPQLASWWEKAAKRPAFEKTVPKG